MGAALSGGNGATNGTFISYEAGTRKGEWTGKFVHANGDVMEGNVRKGMLHGKGKYVFKNGDVYVGEFRQSKFEGKGKYLFQRSGGALPLVVVTHCAFNLGVALLAAAQQAT